jgi:hypothetical protein
VLSAGGSDLVEELSAAAFEVQSQRDDAWSPPAMTSGRWLAECGASWGVVPCPGNEAPVQGRQRCECDGEDRRPPTAGMSADRTLSQNRSTGWYRTGPSSWRRRMVFSCLRTRSSASLVVSRRRSSAGTESRWRVRR